MNEQPRMPDEQEWRALAIDRFGTWPPPPASAGVRLTVICRKCRLAIRRVVRADDDLDFRCPTHGELEVPAHLSDVRVHTNRKASGARPISEGITLYAYPRR